MSVPTSLSQLSKTASLNSPAGTEPIGNNLAPYLNAAFAFIAQLADGSGISFASALNMNALQINNLANGTSSTDAINLGQLKSYEPIGTIKMWSGTATNASVQAAWGTNWALCNGQNGTPNLMDRFVIGAGNQYTTGANGGTTTYALSVANMPAHTHGVNDAGHNHGFNDPGHNHYVNDPGHVHGYPPGGWGQAGQDNGGGTFASAANQYGSRAAQNTYGSGTGIWLNASGTGCYLSASVTGISIQSNGSGAAFTVIPPYYALAYVMKISNT